MSERAIYFVDIIQKFNPHHDSKGRFSTASNSAFFTIATKDSSKQHLADKAIVRAKKKDADDKEAAKKVAAAAKRKANAAAKKDPAAIKAKADAKAKKAAEAEAKKKAVAEAKAKREAEKKAKAEEAAKKKAGIVQDTTVVHGKDLSGSFKRDFTKHKLAIEDIIEKQGFDGPPKIVNKAAFNRHAKESPCIAKRTFAGTSKQEVEAYRDQLYHSKFYVDCGVGGAQYGRGMYMAASYGKTTSQKRGMTAEMRHYQKINAWRGRSHAVVENICLDKSAKIIKHSDVAVEYAARNYKKMGVTKAHAERFIELRDKELNGTLNPTEHREFINKKSTVINQVANFHRDVYYCKKDAGALAAEMGYDAVNAEGHGASGSYTVVLNRTKLIIQEPQ